MAITDLASARTELQARGYSRFSTGRLDSWLNDAKERFEDFPVDWPWLKTSATGAAPLTISDLRRVLSVSNTATNTPLDRYDADAIVEFLDTDLTRTGQAFGWYLSSLTAVAAFPVTATLSVRYLKYSPVLTSSDSPLIPLRYRMTWVDLAEVNVLRYGVKDAAAARELDASVMLRVAEIAAVFEMLDHPSYSETLTTGASVDG